MQNASLSQNKIKVSKPVPLSLDTCGLLQVRLDVANLLVKSILELTVKFDVVRITFKT